MSKDRPVIMKPEIIVPRGHTAQEETYWVNKMGELASKRASVVGLRCCGIDEIPQMGGGWVFYFCAAADKTMQQRRVESYLFLDDGIEVQGNIARMIEIVYRRLMETLERQDAGSDGKVTTLH